MALSVTHVSLLYPSRRTRYEIKPYEYMSESFGYGIFQAHTNCFLKSRISVIRIRTGSEEALRPFLMFFLSFESLLLLFFWITALDF